MGGGQNWETVLSFQSYQASGIHLIGDTQPESNSTATENRAQFSTIHDHKAKEWIWRCWTLEYYVQLKLPRNVVGSRVLRSIDRGEMKKKISIRMRMRHRHSLREVFGVKHTLQGQVISSVRGYQAVVNIICYPWRSDVVKSRLTLLLLMYHICRYHHASKSKSWSLLVAGRLWRLIVDDGHWHTGWGDQVSVL